ncbi:CPBP family glutamic-type intramembrane protease [Bacillus gaemokensis]|uniref:CPBP family glutamic-type intramembrane protease n=1 Tax=Bacillus gaemokensis TaxID=574375 RepID=UPI0034DF2CE7
MYYSLRVKYHLFKRRKNGEIFIITFFLAGIFYGGIVVKSNSIIPAIIWHVVLNILMVFSG